MADAEEVMRAIYGALSNEIVRSTIRTQLQSIPRPMLTKLLGVSAKQLRHFMEGGEPGTKLWDAVAAFEDGMTEPGEVELEAVALNIIADRFPNWHRARVRRALSEAIRPVLRAEGRTLAGPLRGVPDDDTGPSLNRAGSTPGFRPATQTHPPAPMVAGPKNPASDCSNPDAAAHSATAVATQPDGACPVADAPVRGTPHTAGPPSPRRGTL